tara:strand:- start:978 stop:1208 length:231 start_codon:yes stop_codon:yes gene_type:complete
MAKRKSKSKKIEYKSGDIVHLHLDNQMSRIGTGYRIVEIVSFGWKWVKVKTIHTDDRLVFKQRVSRKVFDKLKVIN